MQVTVQIHPSWSNADPAGLFKLLRGLNAIARELEAPAPDLAEPDEESRSYPEAHAPARPSSRPDRGDAWEPPTDQADEDAPTDGRQLLGWSSKQVPDAKGLILSYGRKNGLPSKIVGWSPQQVAAAYRFARGRLLSTTR
jgi:hypothetical protein